jgi:SAM-dependent methyltransferase
MEELWRVAETRVGEFDGAAEAYDRFRPRYPDAIFDAIVGAVDPCRTAVEVGAGTGIATAALAKRGLRVTTVEPSPSMIAIAQSKRIPDVSFVCGRFEDWPVSGPVDVVAAFNSWHWVDPAVAVAKAVNVLRRGGLLALVWTEVVEYGRPPFDQRLTDLGVPLGGGSSVAACRSHVEVDPHFNAPTVVRCRFQRTLDATTFVAVRRTYGGTRDQQTDTAIRELIDEEFGGSVTKIEEAVAYLYARR